MRLTVSFKQLFTAAFVLFVVTEIFFPYTLASQVMLFLFCGISLFTLERVRLNAFLISYVLFIVLSMVNIATGHAVDRSIAVDMTTTLCLNVIFLFAFTQYCAIVDDPLSVMQTYKKTCVFVSCILLVFGLPSVIAGERLNAFGINSNTIGGFAAYSLTVLIYEVYQLKQWNRYRALQMIVFVAVILLSGSRKAALIPLIGLYVMVCIRNPKQILKTTLIFAVGAGVLLFLVLNIPALYKIVGYRIETIWWYLQGMEVEEASFNTRNHFIQYGWEEAQGSPLLGHGLNCFRTLTRAYGTYSHNNYIEILYSLGWLGIAVYYSTSVCALLKIPKILKENKSESVLFLALLIPFLICDYFNVTYFTRRLLVIPAIAIMYIWRIGHGKIKRGIPKNI